MKYWVRTKEMQLSLPGLGQREVIRGGFPQEVAWRLTGRISGR